MEKEFFINNRKKIFKKMKENSVLVLFAGKDICKSEDEEYKFTINRNFYYLTGVNEQNDILMLVKTKNKNTEIMFINEYDEFTAKWLGRKLFKEEIEELSGIKNYYYLKDFDEKFEKVLSNNPVIYLDLQEPCFEAPTFESFKLANEIDPHFKIKNCYEMIAEARMVKEECEIEEVKKAIHITNLAIMNMYKHLEPGLYEYQAESYFDQQIKFHGASDFAFKTIAASGKNGCILHYHANNSKINDHELVLFDLGAEYNLYKADISRTLPADHHFTEQQKLVYNIVLKGQQKVFDFVRPGVTLRDMDNVIVSYYQEELKKIGLIKHPSEVQKYYFHAVSHHLGLDTHDAGLYDKPLEANNIVTVEPGLYIKEWGIGIRIEDDCLVTKTGSYNLSSEIIKTIEDLESN